MLSLDSARRWRPWVTQRGGRILYLRDICWPLENLSTCLQSWMPWRIWRHVWTMTMHFLKGQYCKMQIIIQVWMYNFSLIFYRENSYSRFWATSRDFHPFQIMCCYHDCHHFQHDVMITIIIGIISNIVITITIITTIFSNSSIIFRYQKSVWNLWFCIFLINFNGTENRWNNNRKKKRRESRKKKCYKHGHHVVFDIPSTFLELTPSYVEELVMYQWLKNHRIFHSFWLINTRSHTCLKMTWWKFQDMKMFWLMCWTYVSNCTKATCT